ncbi:MAG TPA: AsmA-like C-terminal region-containing protein, partial [Chitinophagaceae bacterium]|nr:AsmA-like C-terminal region-containing protein [Chitinophagaceae bacterium]
MTKPGKIRSIVWKVSKIFLFSLGGILILLILAPILFRKQIINFAKNQLNKNLSATVDFKDVRISLIRHFPRLDVKFVNLSIIGKDKFPGDTLLFSPVTHAVANFKTLFRSNVKVYSIELIDPVINAKVDSSGKRNFDIGKSSGSSGEGGGNDFTLSLEKYSIKNGTVTYYDDLVRLYTSMDHFNHSGTGNFSDIKFQMKANTTADSVNFQYGAISYLNDAVINMPLDLDIDNGKLEYHFQGEKILINSVPLNIKGIVNSLNDSTDKLDITVKTQQADFKNLLTLIPGVYTKNLEGLQTKGQAVIDGTITGETTRNKLPDFNIKIDVIDGYIKNPDFPEPIQRINFNGSIENCGGSNDSTVIIIRNGIARVGEEPVRFSVGITRPVSRMNIDLSVAGRAQLEHIQQILRLNNMTMRGLLDANLRASGPLAAFESKQVNGLRASGTLQASNFYYQDPTMMPVQAEKVNMNFNNAEAAVQVSQASYNKTDFSATGKIFNFFNFIFVKAPLRGNIQASSPEVNLANWTSSSPGSGTSTGSSKPFIVPAGLKLDIDARADKLISDKILISNLTGKILFAGKKLLFETVTGNAFGGSIDVDGSYSSEKTPLQPDIILNYKLNKLDVHQTFLALVTAKSLMPIGNYLSGTLTSDLEARGKLGDDFSPILNSLQGNGNILLLNGLLQKFAPLEKLAQRLGTEKLKNIATKEIKNRFTFENGRVDVLPFTFTAFENYLFEVAGHHGFDNSIDYAVKLTMPRKELGAAGNQLFQTLYSKLGKIGLDVKPDDKISFFVKITGSMANPDI